METAKEHYIELLAEVYGWMSGDFRENVNQTRDFFIKNNIKPSSTKLAIDLGSGHGIQSVALDEIGFEVTAVDFSEKLLAELKQNTGNRVKSINGDITEFNYPGETKPELIFCMGDTLTHLSSINDVNKLFVNAGENLEEKGKLVISYRDLSTELTGTSRFINVKSDDTRILTCFLEYKDEKVTVNDILHENKAGKWEMKVSSYTKLKLPLEVVLEQVNAAGLNVIHTEVIRGMNYIISEKQ